MGLSGILGPIGGISDILGGLFGSTTKTSTSGSSSGTTSGTSSGTGGLTYGQTPTYDPEAEKLRQGLISGVLNNLGSDTNLSGYTSQGLGTINQGYDAANKALQQTLASRGLSYSPMAGSSTAQLGTQRIGAGIQFQNQIPMLQQQLLQSKLAQALQAFTAMPYSVTGQQQTQQNQQFNQNQNQQFNQNQKQSGGGLLSGLFG